MRRQRVFGLVFQHVQQFLLPIRHTLQYAFHTVYLLLLGKQRFMQILNGMFLKIQLFFKSRQTSFHVHIASFRRCFKLALFQNSAEY